MKHFSDIARILLVTLAVGAVAACATNGKPQLPYKHKRTFIKLETEKLAPGDSQASILSKIPIEHRVVRRARVSGHLVETWLYESWVDNSAQGDRQFVYLSFVDGKLAHWNDSGDVEGMVANLRKGPPANGAVDPRAAGGSGFAVNTSGQILTSNHAVEFCNAVEVLRDGKAMPATVVATDIEKGLALLSTEESAKTVLPFFRRAAPLVREPVAVVCAPTPTAAAAPPTATTGVVTYHRGLILDRTKYQITAAVTPGCDGGPILDDEGRVASVAWFNLDRGRSDLPADHLVHKVDLAVKSSYARAFLKRQRVKITRSNGGPALTTDQLIDLARDSVYGVRCRD